VPWRKVLAWSGLVIAAAVVVAAAVWVVFLPVSDLIANHDVSSVTGPHRGAALQTARDAARGRLVALGAGLFAAGALVYTGRNFTLSRRTFELTEQGQVTDRYTKAIEQLGSDKLDVRIGGIYALERIARDSPRDHPTIMAVLSAFLREHSREEWPPAEPGAEPPERTTRPDVQAAATVIGRRNRRPDELINLNAAVLTRADLTGVDLRGADLTGANLFMANLNADLTGADLTGADLLLASLAGSVLDGTNLTGVNLTGVNLTLAYWPQGVTVPEGWQRDTGSGRLTRASTGPGDAPTAPVPIS